MENYIIANCTDVGRVRQVNEDSMTTFDSPNGRVIVVCDGMGGQNAGDVASQLAVKVIEDILIDNAFNSPAEAITQSIVAANNAILRQAAQNPDLGGMGATCVMLIIKDGKVHYGWVGDSRIYYVAGNNIMQLSKDQSYVQQLVDAGEISEEEAEHHQDKNQITNALGVDGMTPPEIGESPITPAVGSVFLLCSDGLSGMVNNQNILATIANKKLSLKQRADQLVQQALEAGGLDNVTVQLVEFGTAVAEESNGAPRIVTQFESPAISNTGKRAAGRKKGLSTILMYAGCAVGTLLLCSGTFWFFSQEKEEKKVETTVSSPAPTRHESSSEPRKAEPTARPAASTPAARTAASSAKASGKNDKKGNTKDKAEKTAEKGKKPGKGSSQITKEAKDKITPPKPEEVKPKREMKKENNSKEKADQPS